MSRSTYLLSVKETEFSALFKDYNELKIKHTNLEKEHSDLKHTYYFSIKNDKSIKSLTETIDHLEKEHRKLKEEFNDKERKLSEHIRDQQLKFEKEISSNKSFYDNLANKLESVQAIERLCDKQQIRIIDLEEELQHYKEKTEMNQQEAKINNDLKFTDLKKKMMFHIKETQKNVTEQNMKQMDVSTKLTLLQNHQLLVELEYQSNQIEDLLKKKQHHDRKIFEMSKDLEVNREVQTLLQEKNGKYADIIRTLSNENKVLTNLSGNSTNVVTNGKNTKLNISANNLPNLNNLPKNEETKIITINPLFNKDREREFDPNAYSENKIKSLERLLKKKEIEYSIIKLNYDSIYSKLSSYEKKISAVYNLFQIGLQKVYEDEELKNKKEIYVNIQNIQKDDFSGLTSEQKYSVLVVLLKYILPLVNLEDINSSEFIEHNLQNVKMKYQITKKNNNLVAMNSVDSINQNSNNSSINMNNSTGFKKSVKSNRSNAGNQNKSKNIRKESAEGVNNTNRFRKTFNGFKHGSVLGQNNIFKRSLNFC